jgi:hypothetical protein
MSSQILSSGFGRICLIAAAALLLPAASIAQPPQSSAQKASQKVSPSSPQGMLDLALYYYNNDDISGKAEKSLQQLLTKKNEQSPQYETAQYYLAAYYQRKFYLQLTKKRYSDWNTLKQAAAEYRKYTDRFYKQGKHTWLSDSFFNLAMVNLQLGEPAKALEELSKLKGAAQVDPTVYIYQIVWSPQSQSVIDAYLPSARLADYTQSVVTSKDYYFDKALLLIQKWCQSQR